MRLHSVCEIKLEDAGAVLHLGSDHRTAVSWCYHCSTGVEMH